MRASTSSLLCWLLSAFLTFGQTAVAAQTATPLTNGDVIKMTQAGLSEALIVQAIQNAPAAFDLTPDALVQLKKSGVPDAVMREMVSRRAGPASNQTPAQATTPLPFPVELPDGTEIRLRLLTPASSATARPEDPLRFTVIEDVKADGITVIKKGAEGRGRIQDVKKSGSFGRSGKMSFSIDSVAAIDGSSLPIRSSRDLKGDARVGTTVAAVALVGVFGGFVKGKNIEAPAGTEYTVFTDGVRQIRLSSTQ